MSDLNQERADFAARAQAHDYFADIAVIEVVNGDEESELARARGALTGASGKVGAALLIFAPTLAPKNPNAPAPEYEITMLVRVLVHEPINASARGTRKSADAIARRVRQLYHHCYTGAKSIYNFAGQEPVTMPKGQTAWDIAFVRLAGDETIPAVATPKIANIAAASSVTSTVTCATSGAAIWYTTDGSSPWSGNPAATAYTAPIVSTAACTLRVAAEKAAHLPSSIAQSSITL